MSSVILKNVTKTYDNNKTVINNVSLEIKDKEFIVLVGASGCGKSTLLRMIAGLEDISDGKIFIGDNKVNNVAPKDRDIAFVFQSYALYPHMTVRENIAFGLKMRKVPKVEIDKKVQEAAEILNLEEYLDRKPKQLSGGQRQRVALGRAIVRNPKVFLMDEPLSNLDAKLRVQMRSEIKKLHEKLQTTFIYVTHDQTEALTMGDRIVVLNNGIIQQVDSPEEIYNNPKNTFVAGFVGSPQMNFIEGKDLGLDENILYGIRPEKMTKPDGDIKLTVNVDISEMLGSEKIAYFNIGARKCSAKLEADVQIGKTLELSIKTSDMYKFVCKPAKESNIPTPDINIVIPDSDPESIFYHYLYSSFICNRLLTSTSKKSAIFSSLSIVIFIVPRSSLLIYELSNPKDRDNSSLFKHFSVLYFLIFCAIRSLEY